MIMAYNVEVHAMGHLTVIMGCMFAQKTTELLRRIRRYRSIGYSVLVINYADDTRYGTDCIASHDIDKFPALTVKQLADVPEEALGSHRVLVIDEGQFYPDLVEKVAAWADKYDDLHIVVSGLDGDARRRPFGSLLELIPHAEEVVRLSAYCATCANGTVANFSKKITGGEEQVEVGAADKYIPVCRRHYLAA